MPKDRKRAAPERKNKVTVSIDSTLIKEVDRFVAEARNSEVSRSSILEEALQLWRQHQCESYDAYYCSSNNSQLVAEGIEWKDISKKAAKRIWSTIR